LLEVLDHEARVEIGKEGLKLKGGLEDVATVREVELGPLAGEGFQVAANLGDLGLQFDVTRVVYFVAEAVVELEVQAEVGVDLGKGGCQVFVGSVMTGSVRCFFFVDFGRFRGERE